MKTVNFSYRYASRETEFDVYPGKIAEKKGGLPADGFEKAAWVHHNTGVPVTWIVDSVALMRDGQRLKHFQGAYGDEIIFSFESFGRQPLFEKIGVKQKPFGLRNYSRAELVKIFNGYRELGREVLGQSISIGAGYWLSNEVIQAAEEAGILAFWGLCWDQENIDGATHRGSPWFPYYASPDDFIAPRAKPGGVLMLPWYTADLGNAFVFSEHPPFTTHSGELARWAIEYPREYIHSLLRNVGGEARPGWRPLTSYHLECDWMDCSGIYYDEEYSPASEVWEMQRATVRDYASGSWGDWQAGPLGDFVTWYRKTYPSTASSAQTCNDYFGNFPTLRFEGDANRLRVLSVEGEVLAEQAYADGRRLAPSPGFADRRALRERLQPNIKLPRPLQARLKLGAEWLGKNHDLLNQSALKK